MNRYREIILKIKGTDKAKRRKDVHALQTKIKPVCMEHWGKGKRNGGCRVL